jgi:hypothetical protein
MEPGFLYIRGFGGSLFWSRSSDVPFYSRRGLDQIDLARLSTGGTATQAVVAATRCHTCFTVVFKAA